MQFSNRRYKPVLALFSMLILPVSYAQNDAESGSVVYDQPQQSAVQRQASFDPHESIGISADLLPYADYSADDPSGEFDIERAARFIDGVAVKWGAKHGCVTCHTNGYYLIAPADIFRDRAAALAVRDFAEGWVDSWQETGMPRTEIVVAPAAFLTINNMQMDGELRPATIKALGEAWSLQGADGNWPTWLKCNWPPFEQDDHYGVTLMTIAMGMAPASYTNVEPARSGITGLLNYLRNNKPEEVHHRAMMLWADQYFDDVVSDADREAWITELLALQKDSGGWASGDLGSWRQRAPESGGIDHLTDAFVAREYPPVMIDPNGDGYGTGLAWSRPDTTANH